MLCQGVSFSAMSFNSCPDSSEECYWNVLLLQTKKSHSRFGCRYSALTRCKSGMYQWHTTLSTHFPFMRYELLVLIVYNGSKTVLLLENTIHTSSHFQILIVSGQTHWSCCTKKSGKNLAENFLTMVKIEVIIIRCLVNNNDTTCADSEVTFEIPLKECSLYPIMIYGAIKIVPSTLASFAGSFP